MPVRHLRRPVRALLVAALASSALALLPAPAAQAAVPTGPSAVAVAPDGTTYVGFAAGGSLTRVDASGGILAPLTLPRPGPVDGLAVDGSGNVWVSTGSGATKVSPSGTELAHVDYPGVAGCPAADGGADPTRYGAIAVSATSLYVSYRCGTGVQRFSLAGTPANAVTTPARARGVAFGVAQNGQPAKVYVASPDTAQVLVYDETLSSLLFTLDVPTTGTSAARPAGVVVDRYGQLAVSDPASDHVLLFDTNNVNGPRSYSWYRTLGRTGANAGDLLNPTALAQYPVDGPLQDRRGDFFVADTGNGRVQRWNTSGYTYWAAPVGGSGGGGTPTPTAPVNTARPVVGGTPTVGSTLTCSTGSWSGSPTTYSYGWNRNGAAISGATSSSYVVQAGDAGQGLSCFVRAGNAAGQSDYATSDAVAVASGPAAPANTARPVVSGTAEQGQTLSCSTGSWSGSPTSYGRRWSRNGAPIAGATSTSYVVTAADVAQALTCTVTATGAGGSSSATSAAVTPTAPATCAGVVETVSINGGAAYTDNPSVSLRIVPPAAATQVLVSNDGGFAGATPRALAGTCSYAWTLSSTGGRAARTVYVRFLDGAGAKVGQASDDIVLDTAGPAVSARSAVIRSGSRYVVKVVASDAGSGVARLQYATTRGARGTTVTYRTRYVTSVPARFTWVRTFDRAGNASAWVRTVRR